MEVLPEEMIERILSDESLSANDVINFSSTCWKFREIVKSSGSLWRIKYNQRWPKHEVEIVCEDWYKEYITRKCLEKEVSNQLSMMSHKFFHSDMRNIGSLQLNFIDPLINSHEYGYYYLKDFLIEVNSLPQNQALTDKYYGNILLKYIHQRHCRLIWGDLMKLKLKEQTLEKAAIFVTYWCQEHRRGIWDTVMGQLDSTANLVRRHLLQNNKDHPLKDASEETRERWRKENIPGNMFGPEDCKSIIWAINYVLFAVLKFYIAYDLSGLDRKRSGIDHALEDKMAYPIIFAVIYESIARRLGVKVEVLEFKDHCLLRWREDYSSESSPVHYVNTSAEGLFIQSRCPRNSNGRVLIAACNMRQIAQSAASLIYYGAHGSTHLSVLDALELLLVVNPFSLEGHNHLSRLYMVQGMDALEPILKLKDIRGQISSTEWRQWFQPLLHELELYQQTRKQKDRAEEGRTRTVRRRREGIDFAVGMIVRDRSRDRTGVVHGWCLSAGESRRKGDGGSPEVAYNLLLDDGSCECVAQERLQMVDSPTSVSHPSVGRFFDEYCRSFYRANKELEAEYPEDAEALQTILKKESRGQNLLS